MSRLSVSNSEQLPALLHSCIAAAQKSGQRALITLNGAPGDWSKHFASTNRFRFVTSVIGSKRIDRADQITAVLGSENKVIVYQCGTKLDAGLLAAAAGSLRVGGLLLLDMTPDVGEEKQRSIEARHFMKRFDRLLQQAADNNPHLIMQVSLSAKNRIHRPKPAGPESSGPRSSSPVSIDPVSFDPVSSTQTPFMSPLISPGSADDSDPSIEALAEQDRALNMAIDHLHAHETSCIVITGARGRGKSTLLARLADYLSQTGTSFKVTANHESALRSFRKHFTGCFAEFWKSPQSEAVTDPTTLLVDEASNFSISALSEMLDSCQKIVFSTTTEGYENAGRAFPVRFIDQLESSKKSVLTLPLESPWRWRPGDVLDRLINDLLLINHPDSKHYLETRRSALSGLNHRKIIRQVLQQELATDDNLLFQIYSLFTENHYQSSVKDLHHMLDSTHLQVWVLEIDGLILAALLVDLEGGIDTKLHAQIVDGKRRLPHQLLPQMLARKSGTTSVLDKHYARVVRIAVVPETRRKRLASNLVSQVEKALMKGTWQIDAIGASFANDSASMAFWQANGFVQFHAGQRVNPRTGTHSVFVIKSGDQTIQRALSVCLA